MTDEQWAAARNKVDSLVVKELQGVEDFLTVPAWTHWCSAGHPTNDTVKNNSRDWLIAWAKNKGVDLMKEQQ